MLPIETVSDTYRAGVWGLRRNPGIVLAALLLYAGHDEASRFWQGEILSGELHSAGIVIMTATSHAVRMLIVAMLAVPLHAAYLSDGRVAGFRALANAAPVCRVAWRALLIAAAAAIPFSVLYYIADRLLGGALRAAFYGYWWGGPDEAAAAALLLLATRAVFVVLFGISVILLGLGIPRAVALGRTGPLAASIRLGARQFRPMAARLAGGPGLVLIAHGLVQWKLVGAVEAAFRPLLPVAQVAAADLIAYAVHAFCAAMTASILADAYRRAETGAA